MIWNGLDENRILELADIIERRGQKWIEDINADKEYIYNCRPIIEVTTKKRCPKHNARELGHAKIIVPFFWSLKEQKSMLNIPLDYCKYCKKLMMQETQYDKFKNKGKFLCKLMKKNVIFNDLTEDMVIKWRETGNPPVKDGLCSINENDAKELINLQKKRAKLSIVDKEGNIIEEEVPVYYSMNTGYHYIYTETVQRLKVKGIILCKLYSYNNLMELNGTFENLNTESIIHQYGYNVSAIENLTAEQRRCILYGIITNRIATIEDIKNHLSFLIRVKKNVPKMTVACSKWKEDFEFLDKMEIDKYDEVIPTELIMKSVIIYD